MGSKHAVDQRLYEIAIVRLTENYWGTATVDSNVGLYSVSAGFSGVKTQWTHPNLRVSLSTGVRPCRFPYTSVTPGVGR
jgi:hypothetical protein